MAFFSRAAWPRDRASVMEMEAQTGWAEGAVQEWGLVDRPWPWWSRRGAAGGQHTGFFWELGWQPRGWERGACLWGGPEAEGRGAAGAGGLSGWWCGQEGRGQCPRPKPVSWVGTPGEAGGGVPSSVCVILHLRASLEPTSGKRLPGSRPQSRMRGMWRGGEQLLHQSLFLVRVYF